MIDRASEKQQCEINRLIVLEKGLEANQGEKIVVSSFRVAQDVKDVKNDKKAGLKKVCTGNCYKGGRHETVFL